MGDSEGAVGGQSSAQWMQVWEKKTGVLTFLPVWTADVEGAELDRLERCVRWVTS